MRRFEDLIVWQLADRLQREVLATIETGPAAADRRFCDQIRDSTRSARANTAEGFGRYYPREFIRFLRIAAASLHETKNHLHEALNRGFIGSDAHLHLIRLTLRALKANIRLQQSLQGRRPPDSDQR